MRGMKTGMFAAALAAFLAMFSIVEEASARGDSYTDTQKLYFDGHKYPISPPVRPWRPTGRANTTPFTSL